MTRSAKPARRTARQPAQPAAGTLPTPDPSALRLLADIADAGSLTAAAQRLGTTQPALSKQLKRLERSLGVAVFERSLRGVRPTEYGAALLPRARAIREQARQAGEEVAQRRGRLEGRVVVALSHFATLALMPSVLPAFRERWPGVALRILPPTFHLGRLREGLPDFAVMSLPVARLGNEYSTRAVYTTTVAAIVRAGHPLIGATRLRQLADADWILPSPESSIAQGLARAMRDANLAAPRCNVTCETLTGLETLVAHSDLVGAIPLEVQRARALASGLVRLPLAETIEGPRVAVLRWADARPTPAASFLEQAFVDAAHRLARRRGR
ncbi:MAG: LysR substrate-binding domain-containing protein [Lautropia sp.]